MKALSLLFRGLVPALAVVLLASCAHDDDFEKRFGADAPREKIIAVKASGKITLDGNLNEGAWAKAPAYAFQPPARNYGVVMPKVAKNQDAFEPGMAKLVYDDKYLYIGAVLQDSDVVQYGKEDQAHLYLQGDLFEIFLKSEKSPKYWELYAAPNGKKTTFIFESRGYARADWGTLDPSFLTAATVQGTINNYNDKDKSWTVEVAIPLKMLQGLTGVKFDNAGKWTILLGRYNYNFGQNRSPASAGKLSPDRILRGTCPQVILLHIVKNKDTKVGKNGFRVFFSSPEPPAGQLRFRFSHISAVCEIRRKRVGVIPCR